MMGSPHSIASFRALALCLMMAAIVFILGSCGGGGGSGGGAASPEDYGQVTLTGIAFIDPSGQTVSRTREGPSECSLVQRVRLDFSGPLRPEDVDQDAIVLRHPKSGVRVRGSYELSGAGRRVTFTPDLPFRPAFKDGRDWIVDTSFQPGEAYQVVLPMGTPEALSTLVGVSSDVAARYQYVEGPFTVSFETTEDPEHFWTGVEAQVPKFLDVTPKDGALGVSARLFGDDAKPFEIFFDAPLDPALDNVGPGVFRVIDVADKSGTFPDRDLAADVTLSYNGLDGAVVRIEPKGILPPGHMIGLAFPNAIRGLGGGTTNEPGFEIVSTFGVQNIGTKTQDAIAEKFEDRSREERTIAEIDPEYVIASWDGEDSNRLEAVIPFPGQGELGRFIPFPVEPGEESIVILNTEIQEFPLIDGSTPDARSGTVIEGGVFNFSHIRIPKDVTIVAVGRNPLILTATEECWIEGKIDATGQPGDADLSKDKALSPNFGGLGGPSGGRGGASHPTVFDGGVPVSPRAGTPGASSELSPLDAGQPGMSAVWNATDISCGSGKGKPSGGGGGSLFGSGETGRDGKNEEDVTSAEKFDAEGRQIYEPIVGKLSRGGLPGETIFRDGSSDNDFVGGRGEFQSIFGGQGGGGAGSRLDSYWCEGRFPGLPPTVADSRGGGGGGGGGAVGIISLANIELERSAVIDVSGGPGGLGEAAPNGTPRGAGGGGGSGGMVVLMTSGTIQAPSTGTKPRIWAKGGSGAGNTNYSTGGDGGHGLVQFQVTADLPFDESRINVDPGASLIPPEITPSEISSESIGQSAWINLGTGVFREGSARATFYFDGIDDIGRVITDEEGFLVNPNASDIRVDQLPVYDPIDGRIVTNGFKDRIPDNALVRIEFQGAEALSSDRDEINPERVTQWSPSIASLNDHDMRIQFVRFRVIMDLARNLGYQLGSDLPRVATTLVRLRFSF